MEARGPRAATEARFNLGRPLAVVRLPGGALGVLDDATGDVWRGWDAAAAPVAGAARLPRVALPGIPAHHGAWKRTSIGGVSTTVRRVGLVRARPTAGPVTLFATHAPTPGAVAAAVAARCPAAAAVVCEEAGDDAYGHVTELRVHDADEAAHVAAVVARAGARPLLEDPALDARRPLGVERLDRIEVDAAADPATYGLKRGAENWRFPWMPPHWARVPITWTHLAENVADVDLAALPYPLRTYAARQRATLGTRWTWLAWPFPAPPTLECAPLSAALAAAPPSAAGGRFPVVAAADLLAWGLLGKVAPGATARGDDGRLYRVCDPLAGQVPFERGGERGGMWVVQRATRYVSAALSRAQSMQLIAALYALHIERVDEPEVRRALALVLYRYMVARGYTARYLGRYEQEARHIGNGGSFRTFRQGNQDADAEWHEMRARSVYTQRACVKAEVINRLLDRDGVLRARGSKGNRRRDGRDRPDAYQPRKRARRSRADEEAMAMRAA